ncbi:hypothetical protein, partial [Amaricoccus sp.]|uniref:hypothetical protein n=1 Tax=Amaricoccus sp. TaxID=1872485 RepID=UPI002CDA4203
MEAPWQTRPYFHGDDWHELRDAQYEDRWDDLAMMVGRVSDMYRRASVVMGREDDPVAEALRAGPFFDGRSLTVAQAHLAAHWRWKEGHVNPSLPGILDMELLLEAWRKWVMSEVTLWIIDSPILVRRAAIGGGGSLGQTPPPTTPPRGSWG